MLRNREMPSTSDQAGIRVTGASVLLPELGILGPLDLDEPGEAVEPNFRERLGRKGLRYNTKATLLALAAVTELLETAGPGTAEAGESCGLIAASAYGTYSAVCGVAEQLTQGGVNRISPMDLPNASSNILASQIAIRFGIKGVCLTVDDGLRSGESVLRWASRLLRAGRCERVIAVTAESPSEYEQLLRGGRPLVTGAVAMMLERADDGGLPPARQEPLPDWAAELELASLSGMLQAVRPRASVPL